MKWSEVSNTDTEVVAGDKVLVLRESAGAAGSILMDVEDFDKSVGTLTNRASYIMTGGFVNPQPGGAVLGPPHVPPIDITIPSVGNLSTGKALTVATDDTTFSIKKNGVEVGTIFVGAGTGTLVFDFPSDVSMTGGADYLTVHNPASPDLTLAFFGWSIFGLRV